jgi:nicotinate-nucleotide adenylyltransferase
LRSSPGPSSSLLETARCAPEPRDPRKTRKRAKIDYILGSCCVGVFVSFVLSSTPEGELSMPRKIGVLGGTFSPVHIGHLRAAEEAIEALGLDSLFFLPAAVPPHKTGQEIVSFEHRWQLLKLSIAGNPRFHASDLERTLSGKSFTVRSLTELRKRINKESEVYFLLGLDAFLEIDTWWRYRQLFALARLVVVRRPEYREQELEKMLRGKVSPLYCWDSGRRCFVHPNLLPVHYLRITRIDVSSTQIRDLAAQGKSIRYLVPPEAIDYIIEEGLYTVPVALRD